MSTISDYVIKTENEDKADYGWSDDEKLRNCGKKISEYFTENGPQPFVYHCRLYDRCDDCLSYRAAEVISGIERATFNLMQDNPHIKLRHLQRLPDNRLQAKLKQIKRHGGTYRRVCNGDGTTDLFIAIEDSKRDNDKLFGQAIELKIEYEGIQPHETFSLDNEYFKNAVITNRTNGTKFSGKLHKSPEKKDKDFLLRCVMVSCRSKADWDKKHEVDRQLAIDTNYMPLEDQINNEEYQADTLKMAAGYINVYTKAGIDFDVKISFVYVTSDHYKKWNEVAAYNRSIYEIKKVSKNADGIDNNPIPSRYLDIFEREPSC